MTALNEQLIEVFASGDVGYRAKLGALVEGMTACGFDVGHPGPAAWCGRWDGSPPMAFVTVQTSERLGFFHVEILSLRNSTQVRTRRPTRIEALPLILDEAWRGEPVRWKPYPWSASLAKAAARDDGRRLR